MEDNHGSMQDATEAKKASKVRAEEDRNKIATESRQYDGISLN